MAACRVGAAAVVLVLHGAAGAAPLEVVPAIEPGVNIVALAWGRIPDHPGSNDSVSGVAPLVRMQLAGERYVQLVGTELGWNLIDHPRWRAGPLVGLRGGRQETVDPVVRRLQPVKAEVELGAFVTRVWSLGADPRHLVNVSADLLRGTGRGHGGWVGSLRVNAFVPVSRAVLLNAGLGRGLASGDFTTAYHGVGQADSAVFPSLGGRGYAPGGGWTDWRVTYGAVVHLSPQWHLVAGGRWLRLDAGLVASPVVAERGARSSSIVGVGLGYVWR
jgi:outer membrane scaffolding protein for murein synthesis (MipA/OmpV family)